MHLAFWVIMVIKKKNFFRKGAAAAILAWKSGGPTF
jgi:hypothetical protein